MTDHDYAVDVARACRKHLSASELEIVIRAASEHPDRVLRMHRATIAGTRIGGDSAEEAERNLARTWLRLCREAMAHAPGGDA